MDPVVETLTLESVVCFSDVDECAMGTSNCGAHGVCINTNGSYDCACRPGYSED